ncbi:MAG: tRNA pseudouridine(38-40) synthase TruA [Bacteroidales bacterium]|nr:tRNA pseudouridine(38-40) synthase TruA [Bacteroidales bacterium]
MKRYFIHLAYNGSNYHGWQRQNNAHSVQAELEKCLSLKLSSSIDIMGCGRTDTGVHARNFYAHFDLETTLDVKHTPILIAELNRFLPRDIVIYDIWEVPAYAHARFDATERTYQYHVHQQKIVFGDELSYFVYTEPDLDKMNKAAAILLKYNDFTSFAKLHSQTKTNLCTIKSAFWTKRGEQLVFEITADRFLRNMVRAIVGTLLEVGQGRRDLENFRQLIESRDRNAAGYSVPAHALFLHQIRYPEDFFEKYRVS